MATSKKPDAKTDDVKKPSTAVAEKPKNEVSTDVSINFEADAGVGMEEVDKDSFAIPFIAILQGLSPQMETVEGAKLGRMINTVTNEMYEKLNVVPVHFQRRYNRWAPRSEGGGFKGSLSVGEVETMLANGDAEYVTDVVEGKERTKLRPKGSNDELKDTRNHFVLIVGEDGSYSPALISMASTQIKRSKKWMSLMNNIQITGAGGKKFNPPSFSHIYQVGPSEKETNNDGSWYSFTFAKVGQVTDPALYGAAKDFHKQVVSGNVKVADPTPDGDVGSEGSGEGSGAF